MKQIVLIRVHLCLSAAMLLCLSSGGLKAQERLDDYALILSDRPLSRQVSSRHSLGTAAALDHGARIAAAQQVVANELVQRGIRMTGSARTLVNAVFVRAARERLAEMRSIPGVVRVQYLPPAHRTLDRALDLVNASAGWTAIGGVGKAGAGIKMGILDTGIDQDHAAFQDSSLTVPAGFPKGDAAYTNTKVIVARSYVAMLPFEVVDASDSRPDDITPRDRSGHGTAIAMIAAGARNTGPLATITGVAPKAFLGNYKIFGSPGVNDATHFPVIIQALEDAISDGMDIVALPVGDPALYGALQVDATCTGPAPGFQIPSDACDIRAQAVENAVGLGLTVVVPAGNDGQNAIFFPALSSIDTPGTAPSAITVGASTNAHVFYAGVIVPGKDAPTKQLNALFGDGQQLSKPLNATVRDVSQLNNNGRACAALAANSLAGSIALVQRGDCTFNVKVTNAANAGAVGVIFVQNSGQEIPFPPTGLTLTGIPVAMVGNTDGTVLQNFARQSPSQKITLDPTPHAVSSTVDAVADFSSRGPAIWTGDIKPELIAPGADLYTAGQSYDPNGGLYNPSGYAAGSGTSLAVGLVAGAAALVQQQHPSFTPGQIKSALVNTANGNVIDGGATARITAAGAGKLDVGAAVNTPATIVPATASFGVLDLSIGFPVSGTLTLTNVTKNAIRFDVQIQRTDVDSFASVTVSPNTGLLAPGSTQLSVQLQGSLGASGSYEGHILIHIGTTTLRVPYLYIIPDGAPDNVLPLAGASFSGSVNDTRFLLAFRVIDQFGVSVPGLPVLFGVTAGDGVIEGADTGTDSLGIAAALVDLGSQLGDQIFTGAVAGTQLDFDGNARTRPKISAGGVVNAGSHVVGKGVAPGSYVEIYGVGLSQATRVAATAYLPVALAGISVSFDAPGLSVPGHIYFVTPSQVDVQIPWELEGLTSVVMKVNAGDSASATYTVPLAKSSPAAFEIPDSSGSGTVVAALDATFRVISSANRAPRSANISLYVNGLGPVDHTPPSGDPTPVPPEPFARTKTTPKVTIGGKDAHVSFSGLAPGIVGLYQINVTVPADAPTGLQSVVVTINGIDSKAAKLPVQ